jgi:putative copper resistance protein D
VIGLDPTILVVRWLHFTVTLGLFGIVLFGAYAGPEARQAGPRRVMTLAAFVSVLTAGLWIVLEAGAMSRTWQGLFDLPTIIALCQETAFGKVAEFRLILGLTLFGLSLMTPGIWRDRMLGLAAALMVASLGFIGHAAMKAGIIGLLVRVNQAVHLLAVGAWLGGLVPLAYALRAGRTTAATALRRFSVMGMISVGLLAATGIINSVRLIHGWTSFIASEWGAVLLVKLALISALVAMASINRWHFMARLADPAALRHLTRMVAAEQMLGLLILATAIFLGSLPPP